MLRRRIPLLGALSKYSIGKLKADLLAGLLVGVVLIPQGIAYALLAGMPPIYGLYAGLVPLMIFAFFGTSRQLSIGPVATCSLLVLAGISQVAEPFTERYIELVLLTGCLVGVGQALIGVFRLGFLTNFLSNPVISGFISAAAMIIIVSQLGDALGIKIERPAHIFQGLSRYLLALGDTNSYTLGITLISMLVMFGIKKWNKKIPGALIVVMLGIIISKALDLSSHGVAILGVIPEGLPSFYRFNFSMSDIQMVLPTVFTVTIIGLVEIISLGRMLELKNQDMSLRPNQELFAMGMSKIGGAFFQAMPTSASFTRTAINNNAKAKTQVAAFFAALLILITLLFLTSYFYYLPKAILAAIILLAVPGLFDIGLAKKLWRTDQADFYLMLSTFLGTLLLGIEYGVLLGVVLSIGLILYRSVKPNVVVLGKVPGKNYYRNIDNFENAVALKDKLIIRFEHQLYFANASYFKYSLRKIVNEAAGEITEVYLDAKSISDIDSTGMNALDEIDDYFEAQSIHFYICGAIHGVREKLKQSGLLDKIGEDRHFIFLDDAIGSNDDYASRE